MPPFRLRPLSSLFVALALVLHLGAADTARRGLIETALDRYVAQPDASFAWKKAAEARDDSATGYVLDLVSQNWLTPAEVNRTEWRHWLVIVKWRGTEEARALYAIEDPFSYRDRLTMPKLLIHACGDQFFAPDSTQFYFDGLAGVNYLRSIPNTDHGLKNSDAYQTLRAWHFATLNQTPLPQFSWQHGAGGTLTVTAKTKPTEVLLWQATNPAARDFRLETLGPAWKSSPVEGADGVYTAAVPQPEQGWSGYLMELTFDLGAGVPLKLTTNVTITPATLPFAAPNPTRPRGFLQTAGGAGR